MHLQRSCGSGGSVACDDGLDIKCYDLWGRASTQERDDSSGFELARLMVIYSNSLWRYNQSVKRRLENCDRRDCERKQVLIHSDSVRNLMPRMLCKTSKVELTWKTVIQLTRIPSSVPTALDM